MPDWYNRKEEVLTVELTPLGREALSRGDFSPEYYTFCDTDIVYDARYSQMTSSKFLRVEQIQDLERTKPQTNFKSVSTSLVRLRAPNEENYEHHSFLGTSKLAERRYPAISIKTLNGHFTGSIEYETTPYSTQRIPVLEIQMDHFFNTV